jgi:hypothetical protein
VVSGGSGSTRVPSSRSSADGIAYDPTAIARRDGGWEETLSTVLVRWVEAVAKETRREVD